MFMAATYTVYNHPYLLALGCKSLTTMQYPLHVNQVVYMKHQQFPVVFSCQYMEINIIFQQLLWNIQAHRQGGGSSRVFV